MNWDMKAEVYLWRVLDLPEVDQEVQISEDQYLKEEVPPWRVLELTGEAGKQKHGHLGRCAVLD